MLHAHWGARACAPQSDSTEPREFVLKMMDRLIQLNIQTLSKKRITFQFNEADTVHFLQDFLERLTGCPADLQVIKFHQFNQDDQDEQEATSADAQRRLVDFGLSISTAATNWACMIRKLPSVPQPLLCRLCGRLAGGKECILEKRCCARRKPKALPARPTELAPTAPSDSPDTSIGEPVPEPEGAEGDGFAAQRPQPTILANFSPAGRPQQPFDQPLMPEIPLHTAPPPVVIATPVLGSTVTCSARRGEAGRGATSPHAVSGTQSSPSMPSRGSNPLVPASSAETPAWATPMAPSLQAPTPAPQPPSWWEAKRPSATNVGSTAPPVPPPATPKSMLGQSKKDVTSAPVAPFSVRATPVSTSRQGMSMSAARASPRGQRIRRADLERVGRLGVGAFGVVTLEADRRTGRTYALKAVSKGYLAQLNMQYSVLNEKAILRLVESPFVVRLLATYNGREHVYFLLEAALGGELFTTYERLRWYGSEPHARFYVACVTEALSHLHERNVIYRDLKPENLLLDARGYCKLTDMGLAKVTTGLTYTMVGTPDYMAPEVIKCIGHAHHVDWWMLGVLLYELLSGRAPFEASTSEKTYELVKKGIEQAHFPKECRGPPAELVRNLCRQQPESRMRAPALRDHPWFRVQGFSWTQLQNQRLPPPHRPTCKGQRDLSNFRQCESEDPPAVHYVEDGNNWDADFEEDIQSAELNTMCSGNSHGSLSHVARHAANGAAAAALGSVVASAVDSRRGVPSRGGA